MARRARPLASHDCGVALYGPTDKFASFRLCGPTRSRAADRTAASRPASWPTRRSRRLILAERGRPESVNVRVPSPVPVRPTLVVFDESADLLGGIGLAKPEAQRVRDAVGLLARQGRACGIHVVAAFTRPDTDAVPGAVRDQFAARVALGPLSPDGSRMLFGAHRLPDVPDGPTGSGISLGLDGSQRLRRVRVPWVTIDDVRRRHGLPLLP